MTFADSLPEDVSRHSMANTPFVAVRLGAGEIFHRSENPKAPLAKRPCSVERVCREVWERRGELGRGPESRDEREYGWVMLGPRRVRMPYEVQVCLNDGLDQERCRFAEYIRVWDPGDEEEPALDSASAGELVVLRMPQFGL